VLFRLTCRASIADDPCDRFNLNWMIDHIALLIDPAFNPWVGHHPEISVDLSIEELSPFF
jgi:hypothetical protein